jgi:AcrR family transcriptional regulator
MTEKQEKILSTALKLFAEEGFAATSTNKVAKMAGVSEGLIFRHFKNKDGLLQAILMQAEESAKILMSDIILTAEPKELIRKALELPFNIAPQEYEMWRLTYALKWQTNQYESSKLDPLKLVLKSAFEKLNYADPAAEAELLLMFVDGAATALLLHEPNNKTEILNTLKSKYKL